jgi:hypothetical protein
MEKNSVDDWFHHALLDPSQSVATRYWRSFRQVCDGSEHYGQMRFQSLIPRPTAKVIPDEIANREASR